MDQDLSTAFQLAFLEWSRQDAGREASHEFPFVSQVKHPTTRQFLRFMGKLSREEQLEAARALPGRWDRVEKTAEQNRWAERWLAEPDACESGQADKRVDRRLLRKGIRRRLDYVLVAPTRVEAGVIYYLTPLCHGSLMTAIDTGGRGHEMTYSHGVVDAMGARLCWHVSLLQWLGIAGQTSWKGLRDEDIPEVSNTLLSLCIHFRDAVNGIMQGV